MSTSDSPASTIEAKAAPVIDPATLAPNIEALLFSVDRPLAAARLAECLELVPDSDTAAAPEAEPAKKSRKSKQNSPAALIKAAVDHLNTIYEQTGRAFRIELLAGGYRVMTLPTFAPILERYHGKRERSTLSRAALESLAIVAYKQPVTRASLESIRGVACGEVLRSLMERRLVTIVGRAEEVGRPMLYGTTRQFLETFGLASLKDLPTVEEFRAKIGTLNDDES